MELWDIYDKFFVKTGRKHERGKPITGDDFHLIVHIYPINSKGQLLIQKRADTVSWKPGYWASTGGSAISGDDAWTTCQKELWEELGIRATPQNSYLAMMFRKYNSFCVIWLVRTDVSVEELTLQPAEVTEARWVTREEIKELEEKGQWIGYSYMDFLYHLIDEEFGTIWKDTTSNM
ncbi:MAG: NUDIX domain-containing protein [Clostridiales bacterium]|jgi:8-oxo-dGTP diphosphatase|nr:NUDIX domain-containing protein [Clostridiales bacterium]